MIKGQNFRLKLGDKFIAGATNLQIHVSSNLEDTSSKDSTGNAQEQEMTGYSYDLTSDSFFSLVGDTTGASSFDLLKATVMGQKVTWEADMVSGAQNREAESASASTHKIGGTLIFNDGSITAQNRQNSTATFQAQGTGELLFDGEAATAASFAMDAG